MRLPRRAPREVYRVFGESDFLAGAEGEHLEPARAEDGGSRRSHRVAGAAMLAGAVAALGAVLVLQRPGTQAPERSTPASASFGDARGARGGSATYPTHVPAGSHAIAHFVAQARTRRALSATWSAGKSFTGTTPTPAVDGGAGATGPPQAQGAEFGFER